MCYYLPNQPPCTCTFYQLIQPCHHVQLFPSTNNNPKPFVQVCPNRYLMYGVGARHCLLCSSGLPRGTTSTTSASDPRGWMGKSLLGNRSGSAYRTHEYLSSPRSVPAESRGSVSASASASVVGREDISGEAKGKVGSRARRGDDDDERDGGKKIRIQDIIEEKFYLEDDDEDELFREVDEREGSVV